MLWHGTQSRRRKHVSKGLEERRKSNITATYVYIFFSRKTAKKYTNNSL